MSTSDEASFAAARRVELFFRSVESGRRCLPCHRRRLGSLQLVELPGTVVNEEEPFEKGIDHKMPLCGIEGPRVMEYSIHAKLAFALVVALILFASATYARYVIHRRQFLRRNAMGVEVFQSYRQAFWVRQCEGIAYRAASATQPVALLASIGCVLLLALLK